MLVTITLLTVLPASADVTISFNPVGLNPDNLHVYNATGGLVGIYNTSSPAVAFADNSSYSILVVPANNNLLGNHPDTWFSMFVGKLQENAVSIIILLFCIGLLIAAVRRH